MSIFTVLKVKPQGALVIHPAARSVYKAWLDAGPISHRLPAHALVDETVLIEAMRYLPLPVVRMTKSDRYNAAGARFGVLGRFHLYHQINIVNPPKIAVEIIDTADLKSCPGGGFETLAQAMYVIDIGGRCQPLRELAAVQRATKNSPWPSLVKERMSLRVMARMLGVGVRRLRPPSPGTPKPTPTPLSTLESAEPSVPGPVS